MDQQAHHPRRWNVLFICTGNCCRSQMGEALLRHIGGQRFAVRSAGSDPAGFVSQLTAGAMRRMGVSMEGQHSKGWEEVAGEPHDIIITLCDSAACAPAPVWAGEPVTVHWSLEDPGLMPGTPEERQAAARIVARRLRGWIEKLAALPLDDLSREQLQAELEKIPTEA